jgi:hypothetical protein
VIAKFSPTWKMSGAKAEIQGNDATASCGGKLMALVVFLRGVNVGGHRTFRPSALAKQSAPVNIPK